MLHMYISRTYTPYALSGFSLVTLIWKTLAHQGSPTPGPWPLGNRAVQAVGKCVQLHLHKHAKQSPPPPTTIGPQSLEGWGPLR